MKRIKTALIILLLLLVVTVPCSAEESNYIISGKDKIPVSTSYINEAAISDFQGTLNSAQDIFIDENDKMYIADTGNNRVVVAKTDGTVLSVITSADGIELKGPEGVYADNFGSIFVADTGNERILHFSSSGKYIESFLRPESDYLGETYLFNPSKIVVNSTGYIYTLKSQTIMTVDANNRFRGYLGQPDVGFNLSEALIRMFASAEQIKAIKKREAEPYINIDIGKDGLIYATSREIGSEIKVLNSVGENLYRTSTASSRNIFQKITGTFFSLFNIGNYAAKGFQFGENTIVGGKQTAPSFADIAVDNNGIITVINSINNILYQYDANGKATCAYLVARGKKSSPTKEGLRIVTHVESYPYKSAPASTKRRKKPWDYGPRIICLDTIDPETGKHGRTGQFIHGNANPKSIGEYASLGCIRMDNGIIKKLAKEVKKGDLILMIRR